MEVKNIEFSYDKKSRKILDGISFEVADGKITTFIGANGCGKSTLFNVMTKNLKPQSGEVVLNGKNIADIPLKKFAREVSIVHQYNTAPNDLTVEKLVGYGRIAYSSMAKHNREEDQKYIDWALKVTGTDSYRKKNIASLSGGQRQRVWIAMALAQNTKILFLDEPTTYLDIKYQLDILKLIKKLNTEYEITIIMVLHDINQAVSYSDEIIAMKDGKILAKGKPEDIITEDILKQVYGISLLVKEIDNRKFVITV